MHLSPIKTSAEPGYPTHRPVTPTWRKIVAAVAASAALLLPACGEDTTRLAGEPPLPEIVQLPGAEQVVAPPKPLEKPPEVQTPIIPDPQIRLGGEVAPVSPPPEVRLAGRPRSPDMPKWF